MQIQIADQRPALTLTLGLAKKLQDPLLPQWEEEMTKMLVEVTRKFHGSLTSHSVTMGLRTTIGILSLGLQIASEGAVDPDFWLAELRAGGIKGVAQRTTALLKELTSLPASEEVFPAGNTAENPRQLLLLYIKEGYQRLMENLNTRKANQKAIALAQWMLNNTTSGKVARRDVEATLGPDPIAETVFGFVIPRECHIDLKYVPDLAEIWHKDPTLEDDVDLLDFDIPDFHIVLPPRLYNTARKNYDAFVQKVPEDLRCALVYKGRDWFERFVEKGSSRSKKTESAVDPLEPTEEELKEIDALLAGDDDDFSFAAEFNRKLEEELSLDTLVPPAPKPAKKTAPKTGTKKSASGKAAPKAAKKPANKAPTKKKS